MNRRRELAGVEFTPNIPRELVPGVLYVSMQHATAIHACMCGCGQEIVTPFGARSWTLTYDGIGVSLWPSIGNAALACRSHYIIRNSSIMWLESERDGVRPQTTRSTSKTSRFWHWLRRER